MDDDTRTPRTSRLQGFYRMSLEERVALLAQWAGLESSDLLALRESLSLAQADKMIENVVGRHALPLGIATNFTVNGRDYLVPMAIEEPSVVAAASHAARLAREGGGFRAGSTDPVMIAQVQLLDVPDPQAAEKAILDHREELLAQANTSPTMARQGGGPRDIQVRHLPDTPMGPMTVVHLLMDCRDAMGANAVNTAAEAIAPRLEALSGGRALLRILSNLTDQRRSCAEVTIPARAFQRSGHDGLSVIRDIAAANAWAVADPYRAATHNKGIFNGIDAVLLATGNDWRAVEAGGHAYAARDGQYRALTQWRVVERDGEPHLHGRLEMPLAVGIVGGATRAHPTARVARKILGVSSAQELAQVCVAVGLAQNLGALRALVSEGIQRGHMRLHARQVAIAAGAPPALVDRIAGQLVQEGQIRLERARELLAAHGETAEASAEAGASEGQDG